MPAGLKQRYFRMAGQQSPKTNHLALNLSTPWVSPPKAWKFSPSHQKVLTSLPMGTEEISPQRQGTVRFIYGANEASIGGKVIADKIVCIDRIAAISGAFPPICRAKI